MIRVLVLADPQLGCYASFSGLDAGEVERLAANGLIARVVPRTEGFEWDARRYALVVAEANRLRPDLVLIVGDMVDDASNDAQHREFVRISKELDPAIPLRCAPGNHDATDDGMTPTPETLARFRRQFGEDCYAVDVSNGTDAARFVVMNTAVAWDPTHVPDEWDAHLTFIERSLSEAQALGLPAAIVGHHPLFLEQPDEPDTYWNVPQARRLPVLELMARYGVRLMLAGHLHRNNVARLGDIEVVASGPVGYPLGHDPSGFRILELRGGHWIHRYEPLTGAD